VERRVVELAQIDFNDAEFTHEITGAMIDAYGVKLQAVAVEEKALVGRTCLRLVLEKMPRQTRRRLRVRPRNLIFRGESEGVGLPVPFTRAEFTALRGKERKAVLATAALLQAYDVTRGQLALVRVLKSTDLKVIDKLKKLEERLAQQAQELASKERWRELMRE
jgi:hypothetical protein